MTIALAPFGKLYETINETLKDHTSVLAACNVKLIHLEGYITTLEAWKASTKEQGTMTDKTEVFQLKKKAVSSYSQTNQRETRQNSYEEELIETTADTNCELTPTKENDTNLKKTEKKLKVGHKEIQQMRDQNENTPQPQRQKISKISSSQKDKLSTIGSIVQEKQTTEKNANLSISKWIAGIAQKTKNVESELQETNMKANRKRVEERSPNLLDLSTYSIENSEPEIPRPINKKRKVSFVEDTVPKIEQRVKHKQLQSKVSGKEINKTDDLSYRRSRITPERKTLFRVANTKINKIEHEKVRDCPAQNTKEKHVREWTGNTSNSGTRHKQHLQYYKNARQYKPETSPYKKRTKTPENRNKRREKTGSSERHPERNKRSNRRPSNYLTQSNPTRTSTIFTHKSNSSRTLKLEKSDKKGEKLLLNRRETMRLLQKVQNGDQIKSVDINIVEFAHKARTDSIFLHITSHTVKKLLLSVAGDLAKRGYTLRETTAEERGHRREDEYDTKEKCKHMTNAKEPGKTTPVTERRTRTKRKHNYTPEREEQKEEDERRKSRETLDQSGLRKKKDKERDKIKEKSSSQDNWTQNDKKPQRLSPRYPKGPFLTQSRREKDKRIICRNTSTQIQTQEIEKNTNKWAWISTALTKYVRK
ncbi:peptidyl-prolyl cis-trans isomerase G-like [Ambystoma mexicanum]|uniref:peptidyl-prolyl cis-trans isomerase G-like n=1 Tax=Ambystoma mexicanum TaxID=8296 RepID=UPI0037E827B1